MKCIESIKPQKIKLDGKVRRGLYIQVTNHDGVVLGETGWVDYSEPGQPKVARLKYDGKFAIMSHPENRDKPHIDTGTDLLRLAIQSLIMSPNQYEALVVMGIDSETIKFYITALDTLLADKTINVRPSMSLSDSGFSLQIPIR